MRVDKTQVAIEKFRENFAINENDEKASCTNIEAVLCLKGVIDGL